MIIRRVIAFTIDALLSIALLFALIFVLQYFPSLTVHLVGLPDNQLQIILSAFGQLVFCLVGFISIAIFGKSPGQKIAKINVVNGDSIQISFFQSVALYLSFMCVSVLLTLGVGTLFVLFREDKRGLHNLITRTYVKTDM